MEKYEGQMIKTTICETTDDRNSILEQLNGVLLRVYDYYTHRRL
jgi:hypothetical protein